MHINASENGFNVLRRMYLISPSPNIHSKHKASQECHLVKLCVKIQKHIFKKNIALRVACVNRSRNFFYSILSTTSANVSAIANDARYPSEFVS